MIETEGRGVLLYLSQEGRGIGLLNKLRAYKLQEGGLDTVEANLQLGLPADLRDYGIGAQILVDLGLSSIRILTNNPKKIRGLEGYGLSVTEQLPIEHVSNPHNEAYLRAKRERMGHTLHHQGLDVDKEMLHDEEERDHRDEERVRFAIVVGRFYEELAERLVASARELFEEAGDEPIDVFDVPGAFELPLAALTLAESGRYDGIACLGAVIRGETSHYDYVCGEAARGITGRHAAHRRALRLRRPDGREHGAGARPHRAAASAIRASTPRSPCWRSPACARSSPERPRRVPSRTCLRRSSRN